MLKKILLLTAVPLFFSGCATTGGKSTTLGELLGIEQNTSTVQDGKSEPRKSMTIGDLLGITPKTSDKTLKKDSLRTKYGVLKSTFPTGKPPAGTNIAITHPSDQLLHGKGGNLTLWRCNYNKSRLTNGTTRLVSFDIEDVTPELLRSIMVRETLVTNFKAIDKATVEYTQISYKGHAKRKSEHAKRRELYEFKHIRCKDRYPNVANAKDTTLKKTLSKKLIVIDSLPAK